VVPLTVSFQCLMTTVDLAAGYYTRATLVPVPLIFRGVDRGAERKVKGPRIREAVLRGRGAASHHI